jgi:hypothetical protein
MCAVHYHHEFDEEADEPERFLMQFWPAPPAPDRIVRQTSRYAASEHARAQATPPPPTPEERAEADRRRRDERGRKEEERRLAELTEKWGGRVPDDDRLLALGGWAMAVARVDRNLLDEIVRADDGTQRRMAAWVARWAAERAGLAGNAVVADALNAVDRGGPLPPSFADHHTALSRLSGHGPTVGLLLTFVGRPGTIGPVGLSPEAAMVWTILATAEPDPLAAAVRTLKNALDGGPVDLAAFRAAFS